ncbi:hypothetical protein R1flu_028699 [Riccia fluitans]|uniref:Centromere protein J n=1 Tax=Riccia fluitans TaxID=41844 RepID=A0ABD1XQA5_9MARC
MVPQVTGVTPGDRITTAQTRRIGEKGETGKPSRKSWVRSVRTFFSRSVKVSPKPREQQASNGVSSSEQNVEVSPRESGQHKARRLVPRSPDREKMARRDEINDQEYEGPSAKKRPYDRVGNAHWQSTTNCTTFHAADPGQTEICSSSKAIGGRQANMIGSTTVVADEIRRSSKQVQKSSEAHTLCHIHNDLSGEAQSPIAFLQDKTTLLEANTGYVTCETISSRQLPENTRKGITVCSKGEDDSITFEVSTNDCIMKDVLHCIQGGPFPVGLAKHGHRGKLTKTSQENRTSSEETNKNGDGFRIDTELCYLHDGENSGGEQTNWKNAGYHRACPSLPQLAHLMVRNQNRVTTMGDEEDKELGYQALQKGDSRSKEAIRKTFAESRLSTSSDSAPGSCSTDGFNMLLLETEGTPGLETGAAKPMTDIGSAGRKGKRSRRRYPSSNSSTEIQDRTDLDGYISPSSSLENQISEGRRRYSLRNGDTTQGQMKKQRCQTGEVGYLGDGSCMETAECEKTDSLVSMYGRYEMDVNAESGDGSHTWKPRHAVKDQVYVNEGNDEWSPSLEHSFARKGDYGTHSNNMKYGQKRAKHASWNTKKRVDEQSTLSVDNGRKASAIRRYRSSHFDPSNDSRTIVSNASKTTVVEREDTLRGEVNQSEIKVSMTKERVVEFEDYCVVDNSGSSLLRKQAASVRMNTCGYQLIEDSEDSSSSSEENRKFSDCEDRGVCSEHLDEDSSTSTREPRIGAYEIRNPREERSNQAAQLDPGTKNKWLQRMGNLCLAQEPEDYGAQDGDGSPQQRTTGIVQQELREPQDSYCSTEAEREQSVKPQMISKSQHEQAVQMTCFVQLQPPTTEDVEVHNKHLLSFEGEATKQHVPHFKEEVFSENEDSTRDINWASNTGSKDPDCVPQKPPHEGNREILTQAEDAPQSLLHRVFRIGCCHVKSGQNIDSSPSSTPKANKLKEDPCTIARDSSNLHSAYSGDWDPSTNGPDEDPTEDQAKESSHRVKQSTTLDGHSRQTVGRCAHAGPRRRSRCILAGAIRTGNEDCQQEITEQPCPHEFIEHECKNEFTYLDVSKRRRKEETFTNSDEDYLPQILSELSPEEETFINSSERHRLQVTNESPSRYLNDLREKKVSWKKCQKRYEATIEEISGKDDPSLSAYLNPREDSNDLDDQTQNTVAESKFHNKDSNLAPAHSKKLASCSNEHSRQEKKVLRDEDHHDQVTRRFRDELFTTIPRANTPGLSLSSGLLAVSCGDCVHHKTRKKIQEVQRHLQDLTESNPFRFSSIYNELLRVEQEIKQIVSAFATYASLEQPKYREPSETSSDSQGQKSFEGKPCKERVVDYKKFHSKNVDVSPVTIDRQTCTPLQRKPSRSKLIPPRTNSCGGPISVTMATRLLDAEVPIDYENGYKVQYIPVDKRGNMGIRHKLAQRKKRNTMYRVEERLEPPSDLLPCAEDSSSSSSGNQGRQPDIHIQDLPPKNDSSSSGSDSRLLYRRHRRKVSKRARHIRKQKSEGEDSDETNNCNLSDDKSTNLDLFVGEAEEHLARLKLAKDQLGRLSPRVNTFYKKPLLQAKDIGESDPSIEKASEGESDSSADREKKRLLCRKVNRFTAATEIPLKRLTAREIKGLSTNLQFNRLLTLNVIEFHLLERRVQRELGAAERNTRFAKCKEQEIICTNLNEGKRDANDDQTIGLVQHQHFLSNEAGNKVLNTVAGNETICGQSSPSEQPNGHMSSLVKQFFMRQKEEPCTEGGQTQNNLEGIYDRIRGKLELLEGEILDFKKGNRKIKRFLKEHEEHVQRLKQEKAAWEQQKASDAETFQKFRDMESHSGVLQLGKMVKLQKERTTLEQARATITTVPRKEERKALEELRATLAQKEETHSKKEEQWRLTGNRLRKANKELSEQIDELRKEIRRLEEQILNQMDTRGRPSHTTAASCRTTVRGRKERENMESTANVTTPRAKAPMTDISDANFFSEIKPSKEGKCQIARTCDAATTMLAKKMTHLEKDVYSWAHLHPSESEYEPLRY